MKGEKDPTFWRRRAEKARTEADLIRDPELRSMMRMVAHGYQVIAERIEERLSQE